MTSASLSSTGSHLTMSLLFLLPLLLEGRSIHRLVLAGGTVAGYVALAYFVDYHVLLRRIAALTRLYTTLVPLIRFRLPYVEQILGMGRVGLICWLPWRCCCCGVPDRLYHISSFNSDRG